MDSSDISDFTILSNHNSTLQVCFNKPVSYGSALWLENSLETTMPAFVLQLAIILALNRLFLLVSASSHVPCIVTNIFTGFLIGPSGLGRWRSFFKSIFPFTNMMPLETLASVTLVYYVFLIGLEVDVKPIKRSCNKKAMVVAIAGTIFTLPVGCGLYFLLLTNMGRKALPPSEGISHVTGAIIWGITLSCSEFSEIARVLADLKLLLSDNGQLALTSALVNDVFSWVFLVVAITGFHRSSTMSLISTIVLVLVCCFVVHPLAKWLFKTVGTGDREFLEEQVVFLLHMVLVFGLISDGLGADSITGAFLLGAAIPKGVLNNAVQDKVQDFVTAFMMPLFFAVIGFRIRIEELALDIHWTTVVLVIVLAFLAKVLCTFMVSRLCQMPPMEGLSLGLLMNTKGTVAIIILSSARDTLALNNQTFGVMLVACWLMTMPVGPVLAARKAIAASNCETSSQRRTMQGTRSDTPLRVLACVHTKRDASAIINLLKASGPTVKSPIQVLAVELIKMTSRPASSLIIKDARKPAINAKSSNNFFGTFKNRDADAGDTLGSFDNLSQAIFADKLRVVSSYHTMHKDIFSLAKQRGVTLLLTTFYKQPTYDGLGAGAATARAANIVNRDRESRDKKKVVLENLVNETPCCLAIFVDRGLGQKRAKEQRLAMFYVGGADDREALCYAWRMCSCNPEVRLTVVRLVWENPNDEFNETDEECIRQFVRQTMGKASVRYLEKKVRDEKETVALLNTMGNKGFDLYIIGRGHGRKMSLAQTVDPVLEEPALGPLGDTLTDLNSASETSILIFQRQQTGGDDSSGPAEIHGRSAYAYFEGSGDLLLRGGHMIWHATHHHHHYVHR